MSLVPRHPDRRPGATLADLPSLAVFGERLAAVDERAVLRGRRGATGLAALVGFLLALGTFTGAAALALTATTGSPVPSFVRGDDTGFFPQPGTSRVSDLRAPDPSGGPPWSVRVGRSTDGLVCIGVGQVQGTGFGVRGTDGRFREVPAIGNDVCGPAPTSDSPVVALRGFSGPSAERPAGATTVVHGSGGKGLDRVDVTTGDGRTRRAAVGRSGTFAVAVAGWPEGASPVVRLRWTGGRERTVRLGPRDSVPDPTGAFGWTTEPVFRVHVPGRASPEGCIRAVSSRGRRTEDVVCVPVSGPSAVLERVASPYGGGDRRVVAVRVVRGDRVSVRYDGRVFPSVTTVTAGKPRRVIRRDVPGRVMGRSPDAGGGPRAALAILPATATASDVRVTVRRDGRDIPVTPVEGPIR